MATKQVICGGGPTGIPASTTVYSCPMGYIVTYPTTDAIAYGIIPTGGTLDLMAFKSNGTLTAAVSITLMLNGVASALTCTVSGTTPGHDSTHSVAVVAGDTVSIRIVTPAGVATRAYDWSMRFTATTSGESILIGNSNNTAPTANQFVTMGNTFTPSSTANDAINPIPELGTFKKFYVNVDTDPTVGGSSVIFTVFNNGGAGNNVVTIAAGVTTGNDTTHTDVCGTVGDPFYIKVTVGGAPTLSAFHWGIVYVSPTPGNFLMVANTGAGSTSSSGARNIGPSGSGAVNTGTRSMISNAFTLVHSYARIVTAPGVGNAWDMSTQQNAANALVTNLAHPTTKGGTTGSVTIALDDRIQFTQNPVTGTPTNTKWAQTLVGYLADPVTNTGNFLTFF